LEDIIAVEISKDFDQSALGDGEEEDLSDNPIAVAAAAKKKKGNAAMQQKIFGKTIVFTEQQQCSILPKQHRQLTSLVYESQS
jgi:hypothetical protein